MRPPMHLGHEAITEGMHGGDVTRMECRVAQGMTKRCQGQFLAFGQKQRDELRPVVPVRLGRTVASVAFIETAESEHQSLAPWVFCDAQIVPDILSGAPPLLA